MKLFVLCYIVIGCILSLYAKWGLDTIGTDYFLKQLNETPENFDLNDPLIQFLLFSIIVLLWPILIISIIKDKNGE